MTMIEQIRAEILNTFLWENETEENLNDSVRKCLEIIDKYAEQEPEILNTLDFAIDASNGDTNYFVGFRNGLRYAKSLVDGEDPQYESCAEQEPKTGRWIALENRFELGDRVKCSECGQIFVVGDDVSRNFCPNCGADMRKESHEI